MNHKKLESLSHAWEQKSIRKPAFFPFWHSPFVHMNHISRFYSCVLRNTNDKGNFVITFISKVKNKWINL